MFVPKSGFPNTAVLPTENRDPVSFSSQSSVPKRGPRVRRASVFLSECVGGNHQLSLGMSGLRRKEALSPQMTSDLKGSAQDCSAVQGIGMVLVSSQTLTSRPVRVFIAKNTLPGRDCPSFASLNAVLGFHPDSCSSGSRA